MLPGTYLRADAAAAFARMRRAYEQDMGVALVLTDAYRSYAEQVDVYARKPHLAAEPSTSNHGWASRSTSVGVQSLGTSQHHRMQNNAPRYGWTHPSWAEPSGSRPEPWHWEFTRMGTA